MRRRAPYPVLILLLVICALPILSVAASSGLANAYGCTLHEGFSNPCVIWGKDRGGTLSGMFVMGWFMLITVPAGAAILLVLVIQITVDLWTRVRRR
ncbi:hypothetical protein [Tateyamaria omphalii]|uniref:Uncharacterized protein n=1 Tax=Tateyamaria omphalii TaxID=299262 RepID=A0A1P8MV10_9RHOB|nr:hypothetical protein [Tateyamaria omphalii]APX11868.1 hypothetical protein BWR18_09380 [Tateyamaria omphalii]